MANENNSGLVLSVDGDLIADALSKLVNAAAPLLKIRSKKDKAQVYIHAKDNKLELQANGNGFSVLKTINNGFNVISAGEFSIPYKGANILAKRLGDARYTFTQKDNSLTVEGDEPIFTLHGNDNLFPDVFSDYANAGSENFITLPKSELYRLLNSTLYAVATNDDCPIFTAVNFKVANDTLTLTATDTHRLAMAATTKIALQGEFNCNIRSDVLRFILPLLKKEGEVQISLSSLHEVKISLNGFDIITRCLEGDFPDCARLVAPSSPIIATVNRSELKAAINLCKYFADAHNSITLCFTNDSVEVSAENYSTVKYETKTVKSGGSAFVPVQAAVRGIGQDYASANFNVNYLLDTLKSCGNTNITLGLSENALTSREENQVALMSPLKGSVTLPKVLPAIAPSTYENVTTIDIDAKVKVA